MLKNWFENLNEHTKEIIGKGSVAFVLKVLGAGLILVFNILVARELGASGAGIFFLALSIITPIAILSRFGMDSSLIRFIAAHAENFEWAQVKGVLVHALKLSMPIAIAVAAVLYSGSTYISESVFNKPDLKAPLQWMVFAIFPLVVSAIFAGALQGLKKSGESILILSVLPYLFAIPILLLGASSWGVNGAAFAYCTSLFLTLLFAWYTWHAKAEKWTEIKPCFDRRILLNSCKPVFAVVFLQQIMLFSPVLLLGVWSTSSDVGIFSAAMRTATVVSLVLIAGNSILAPKFSALYIKGDMEALDKVARQGALMMTLMASPVILFFFIFPEWVMGLFGEDFRVGASVLVVIAIGSLINVMSGSVGILLIMVGKEKELFNVSLLATGLGLLMCVYLIPKYGMMGAAVAASVTLALSNLFRVYTVWKSMGIMTLPFIRMKKAGDLNA